MTEEQEKRWRANVAAMPVVYGTTDDFGQEVFAEIDNLRAVIERLGRERDTIADMLVRVTAEYQEARVALEKVRALANDLDCPVEVWKAADNAVRSLALKRWSK